MSSVSKNEKYLNLDSVRVSYRPKDDSIHITSGDDDLVGSPFHMTLSRDSESEKVIRELMVEKGMIKPSASPVPDSVAGRLTASGPSDKIVLGEDSNGPVVWATESSPHMLLAGAVGSGRTVVTRNLFAHCLTHNWLFYGIDLTQVELTPFAEFTKTTVSIATKLGSALTLIDSLNNELTSRYELMAEQEASHYSGLKEKVQPIMLVVDKANDLFDVLFGTFSEAKMKVEADKLANLVRLGRAAGIHVVINFPGQEQHLPIELVNNLDARVTVGVLSAVDSALVLRTNSAARLPGKTAGFGILSSCGKEEMFRVSYLEESQLTEWASRNDKL